MALPDQHERGDAGSTGWHAAGLNARVKDTPLWPYLLSLAGMAIFAAVTFWLGYAVTAGTLPVCPEPVCPLHSAIDVTLQGENVGQRALLSGH